MKPRKSVGNLKELSLEASCSGFPSESSMNEGEEDIIISEEISELFSEEEINYQPKKKQTKFNPAKELLAMANKVMVEHLMHLNCISN